MFVDRFGLAREHGFGAAAVERALGAENDSVGRDNVPRLELDNHAGQEFGVFHLDPTLNGRRVVRFQVELSAVRKKKCQSGRRNAVLPGLAKMELYGSGSDNPG